MVAGESHYLDKHSTQHLTTESWYGGDHSTLQETELKWIDPKNCVEEFAVKGIRSRAYSIYGNSFKVINQFGPQLEDSKKVNEIIVYYNYFLRPAFKGVSLKVNPDDERIAGEVFKLIVEQYKPDAIVFLSKLAHRHWSKQFTHDRVVAVPHPGCRAWNLVCKSYNGKRGKDLLSDFITDLWSKVKTAS